MEYVGVPEYPVGEVVNGVDAACVSNGADWIDWPDDQTLERGSFATGGAGEPVSGLGAGDALCV
jgi:hypothetical protein